MPKASSMTSAAPTPSMAGQPRVASHTMCLLLVTALACLAAFFQLTGQPFTDWADAVSYQATGKYFIEHRQLMPAPLSADEYLTSGAADFGKGVINYPNFAFSTLVGLLGWLRGDYSLMNGVLSGLAFTVLLGIACYAMMYSLERSHSMAVAFAFAILFQRVILATTARPLSDITLLFFFALAVFASMKDRLFLSGLALGIGYLFREHALMFLPFMPFLSPRTTSLRLFITGCLRTVAAFLPFLLANNLYYRWILDGHTQPDYYLTAYASWVDRWLTPEAMGRLFSHLRFYWGEFGLILRVFILWAAIRFFKLTPLQKACFMVGLLLSFIPCFMWTAHHKVPIRYGIYTILLFHVAIATMLPRARYREAAYVVIAIVAVFQNLPKSVNEVGLAALASPTHAISQVARELVAPMRMGEVFEANSAILTDDPALTYLTLDNPVAITAPPYEHFLEQKGNERFDGIVLRKRATGWDKAPTLITDNHGVSFQRVTPAQDALPQTLSFYKKVPQISTARHSEP